MPRKKASGFKIPHMTSPSGKTATKGKNPNCYDPELRDIIAYHIWTERKENYPNKGGQGQCARKYGCSQQQWSCYETGARTPKDDPDLIKIARFFGKDLQYFKTPPDNWAEVRIAWKERKVSDRKKEVNNGSLSQHSPSPLMDAPQSDRQPKQSISIIERLARLENLHATGMLPSEPYLRTCGTISDLLDVLDSKLTAD